MASAGLTPGLRRVGDAPKLTPVRPWSKFGVIVVGLMAALALAWVAVVWRDKFSSVPAVEKAGGMYAFGDFALGLAVFGVAALVPAGLGLHWLRPVAAFWTVAARVALGWAVLGMVGAAVWLAAPSAQGWPELLAFARVGLMPLTSLGLAVGSFFAPQPRERWILLGVAIADGLMFAVVVLVLLGRSRM